MKRIKNIFSALSTLRRVPSKSISDAWTNCCEGNNTAEEADLIGSLIDAIVEIAKDDEDKATAPGKADKPAS